MQNCDLALAAHLLEHPGVEVVRGLDAVGGDVGHELRVAVLGLLVDQKDRHARLIGGLNQLLCGPIRRPVVLFENSTDFGGGEDVTEPITAKQQCGIGTEYESFAFDKLRVPGCMQLRTHVSKDLMAARMAHGLLLRQRALVFLLTHRRVVGGELFQISVPGQV